MTCTAFKKHVLFDSLESEVLGSRHEHWLGSYPRVEDRYGSPEGNLRGSGLFGESFAWTIRTMT